MKYGTNSTDFLIKNHIQNQKIIYLYKKVFDGFALRISKHDCERINTQKEVDIIYADEVVKSFDIVTQRNAEWHLARLSSNLSLSSANNSETFTWFNYKYDESAGKDATIYILDTGINKDHVEFEGRVVKGRNFIKNEEFDDFNGHGTHVAAIAAGKTFGVAKKAKIVDVKVLNGTGRSTSSSIMAGIEWVTKNAGPKSVISMSFGAGFNQLINEAAKNAVIRGITAVAAVGNNGRQSCLVSPASEPLAIAVAASSINDTMATWSNRGACVDVIAPGQNVTSAWIGSTTATKIKSGTSMATPLVAGLAGYLITRYDIRTPSAVKEMITNLAENNSLRDVPLDTVNRLVRNDILTTIVNDNNV